MIVVGLFLSLSFIFGLFYLCITTKDPVFIFTLFFILSLSLACYLADRAPNLGLVERFNFGLLPRFNLSLVARFNFGLPT